ncbi:MAG: mechanosensitive ion channel family protein [Cyanobacteria bacterium P01_A01_bin.17]
MSHPLPPLREVLRYRHFLRGTATSLMLVGAVGATPVMIAAPIPEEILPERGNIVERLLPFANGSEDIATGMVHLDGYRLVSITAPVIQSENRGSGTPSPIKQRISIVEDRLQSLVKENPETLAVTQQVDAATQLPVLYVNGQELMTVTNQDALLYSSDPDQWATELAALLQQALQRAQQERQADYLSQQTKWAAGIGFVMVGGVLLMTWRQRYLKAQPFDTMASGAADEATEAGQTEEVALATIKDGKQLQHRRNTRRLKLLLLQLGKFALVAGGSFRILGLFPQTRWLQVMVLIGARVPLRLLGIVLLAYLLIRVSFVLIDRLCSAFRQQPFLPSVRSQRSTLRITTVAKVLRGVSVVVLSGIGALGMLAVLGIDLVPLLAGVSVIGLAVSFASQSLIKDTINGFFILLEDQYGVGDIIVVGAVSGLVEHMNLRITQLRDSEGRLITVPNSMIDIVQNLSKDWSRVDLFIDVAYSADPERALAVVEQVATDLYCDRNWSQEILEPPDVLGIENLNHTGMTIRTWIKTVPLSQWNVSREFRRRLKLQLDAADIAIGIPQQMITTQNGAMYPMPKTN